MTTTLIPLGGAGTQPPTEDILTGPLQKRGKLVYQFNEQTGFPGFNQHYEASGLSRPLSTQAAHPGGLRIVGKGAAADGYGTRDSGGGAYLRYDRFKEETWYTLSGRFTVTAQDEDAVGIFGFHMDSQAWDDQRRCYPRLQWNPTIGQWEIRSNSGFVPIPGATYRPGFNENKLDSTYFAFSFYMVKSTPWVGGQGFGGYGHAQIGGQVFDLRGLGAQWANEAPQVPPTGDSFAGGLNTGFTFTNPVPERWGGLIITRWELTVDDILA